MTRVLAGGLLLISVIGAMSVPALAKDRSDREEFGDPNRVICRTEEDIGSRLARSRRCHTAAEWALIKREERLTVDRVQAMKPSQQ